MNYSSSPYMAELKSNRAFVYISYPKEQNYDRETPIHPRKLSLNYRHEQNHSCFRRVSAKIDRFLIRSPSDTIMLSISDHPRTKSVLLSKYLAPICPAYVQAQVQVKSALCQLLVAGQLLNQCNLITAGLQCLGAHRLCMYNGEK